MEDEQNRLTSWVLKKEEDYLIKCGLKDAELQKRWDEKEAQLREKYESRIKELEERASRP